MIIPSRQNNIRRAQERSAVLIYCVFRVGELDSLPTREFLELVEGISTPSHKGVPLDLASTDIEEALAELAIGWVELYPIPLVGKVPLLPFAEPDEGVRPLGHEFPIVRLKTRKLYLTILLPLCLIRYRVKERPVA